MSRIIKPGVPGFYINRRRYHEIESRAQVGVCGYYMGKAIKPGIGVVREFGTSVPVPNLITDIGMDALGSGGSFLRMHLGTGTTPPQFTDTQLQNFGVNVLATNGSATFSSSGSSPWYGQIAITWTSAVGGATGTWYEIGVSNQNTNGNLRSRALILDNDLNPTGFTVQADEQFQGTYIFRIYAPSSDYPETVALSGTNYDTITRAIAVNVANNNSPGNWAPKIQASAPFNAATNECRPYTGGLVSETSSAPTGVINNAPSVSTATYGAGNHYVDGSFRWGSGLAVGTLRTFVLSFQSARFQVEYDPTITKLTSEEIIINQRLGWARK